MKRVLAAGLALVAFASVARAEVPRVVTDIPPVGSLVAQVMGGLGTPEVLTGKGADPHDFQMRPSQALALSKADIVFWIGPELTPWLARALHGTGAEDKAVSLIHSPGTFTMDFKPGEGDHDTAKDDDHDGHAEAHDDHDHDDHDHDGHDHEGHKHEGLNPHAWLDPANAKHWLGVIAADLSKADPEHAAQYSENAKAAAAAIDKADAQAKLTLASVGMAPIVVFHDAFGYYARHYGLNIAGSIALGDAATPGAKRLADIHHMLAETGAVCVFPEANHDPKLVQAVVSGTTAKIGEPLDPAGTSLAPGPKLYEQLIEGLAKTIAACAG